MLLLEALAKLRLCSCRQALQTFESQAQAIHIFVVAEANKDSHSCRQPSLARPIAITDLSMFSSTQLCRLVLRT